MELSKTLFWKEFETGGAFLGFPDGRVELSLGPFAPKDSLEEHESGFYLPGFFPRSTPFLGVKTVFSSRLKDLVLEEPDIASVEIDALRPESWVSPAFADFEARVKAAQSLFSESRLKKVVPAVRWLSDKSFTGRQAVALAQRLMRTALEQQSSGPSYVYGFWNGEKGFLGRTPEVLVSLEGRRLKTMALAGTAWAGKGGSLLDDPKEQEEHAWVVKEILSHLAPWGVFQPASLRTLSFGPLEHLFTPIEGEIKEGVSFHELASALHPTPALGGFPQAEALRWLGSQPEAKWREDFGGPFGFIDAEKGRADCVVLIRGLFWNRQESFLPCGCGIVQASRPEKEWIELQKKRDSVLRLFGI